MTKVIIYDQSDPIYDQSDPIYDQSDPIYDQSDPIYDQSDPNWLNEIYAQSDPIFMLKVIPSPWRMMTVSQQAKGRKQVEIEHDTMNRQVWNVDWGTNSPPNSWEWLPLILGGHSTVWSVFKKNSMPVPDVVKNACHNIIDFQKGRSKA